MSFFPCNCRVQSTTREAPEGNNVFSTFTHERPEPLNVDAAVPLHVLAGHIDAVQLECSVALAHVTLNEAEMEP